MPSPILIPVLGYPDIGQAIEWLGGAFGFTLRLRIGNHRAQLNVGSGAVVITGQSQPRVCSVMVRVEDVDRHHQAAARHGAIVLSVPTDHPYGERQYAVKDYAGHEWTFSQSIADVDPADWGGVVG